MKNIEEDEKILSTQRSRIEELEEMEEKLKEELNQIKNQNEKYN